MDIVMFVILLAITSVTAFVIGQETAQSPTPEKAKTLEEIKKQWQSVPLKDH